MTDEFYNQPQDDDGQWWQTVGQRQQVESDEMKIGDAFPSKYLKADDLRGRTVKVVIDRVEMDKEFGKPVVYFVGKEKGVVLNKTNAMSISADYGDDTDAWTGQEIELFTQKVMFEGKMVDSIRVRALPRAPSNLANDLDDPIPF